MRLLSAMMLSVMASGCIGFCGDAPEATPTEASLYVTDAQGEPVFAPRFSESGTDVNTRCGELTSDQKCVYDILFLSQGTHQITVSSPGYLPEVVDLDTTSNDSVHLAVTLRAAANLVQIDKIVHE